MKKFIKQNWFKLSLVAVLVLISLIFYKALILVPQNKESETLLQSKIDKQVQLDKLNTCFDEANTRYVESVKYWTDWQNNTCVDGKEGGGSQMNRCLGMVIDEINKEKVKEKNDREECIKIYPQI